jgi:uncharacterized protein YqkB
VASDTVRKPSIDTMAYMVLDTTTNIIWHYKKATSNAWLRVGGSISSGLTGVLPVANGGTNLTTLGGAGRVPFASSTTQLTTNANFKYESDILYIPNAIFNGTVNYGYTFASRNVSASGGVGIFFRGTQGSESNLPTTFGYPYINIGAVENKVNAIQSIGFGFTNGTGGYISPAEIGYLTKSLSGYTNGDLVFATRETTNNVAPEEKMRITNTGNVGIGTTSPLALLNVMGTVRINSASAPDANYYLQLENSSSQKAKANAWDTYSDSRIKTNKQPIINAINKINLLNPTYYNQHDSYVENDLLNIDYNNSYKSLGFIAQEVYEVIPEAVNMGTTNELWAMDYTKLIPILTKAIQEQQALIKALEQRIINLENK